MAQYKICCCKNSAAIEKFEGIFLEIFALGKVISNLQWQIRIVIRGYVHCAALQDPLAEAYTSFCVYPTTEFEDFLLQFQSG